MAADFIPSSDLPFASWLTRFVNAATTNATAVGIQPADLTPISEGNDEFQASLDAYTAAQAAASQARAAKDQKRQDLEQMVRALVRRIQAAPGCTDAMREAMGITVPDRTPSAMRASTVANAATRPIGAVDTSQRLRHEIKFWDETTPHSRKKPDGAMGCEIWVKVDGTPPTGEAEMHFVALDTASPYTLEHEAGTGGKTAYYMLRWALKGGVKGPWSETIAATIPG